MATFPTLSGARKGAFLSFTDIDGEPLQLIAREVVWVIAASGEPTGQG